MITEAGSATRLWLADQYVMDNWNTIVQLNETKIQAMPGTKDKVQDFVKPHTAGRSARITKIVVRWVVFQSNVPITMR